MTIASDDPKPIWGCFLRLKSEIWVKAYIRKLSAQDVWAAITRRGDPDAGVVYVCVNLMNDCVRIFGPAFGGAHDDDGERRWIEILPAAKKTDADMAAFLARQTSIDPDIWVVEVESASGDPYLENILAE